MISTIIFFVESPFSERDYGRFGIDILKRSFNVLILDCTALLKPSYYNKYKDVTLKCSELHSVDRFSQIVAFIDKYKNYSLAIDLLGFDCQCWHVRLLLRKKGILRMILQLGLLPAIGLDIKERITQLLSFMRDLPGFTKALSRRIERMILPSPYPDIALCSGKSGFSDPRLKGVTHRIMAHSFDYDLYLAHKSSTTQCAKPYVVFLDEDMVHHCDYDHASIKPPATEKYYYHSLLKFFDNFEKQTGLEIIIAAHPRARYDLRPDLLGSRQFVLGETAQLVRDAMIVLCHQSTSVSYAVLWKKPIIYLTSNELKSSFFGPRINLLSRLFDAPLLNIDELVAFSSNERLTKINESAYANYKELYIKLPGTAEKPIWEIVSDFVKSDL